MELKETWVEVPEGVGTSYGWTVKPGFYEVSSFGRVRAKETKKLLGSPYNELITVRDTCPHCRFNMRVSHLIYGAFHHCKTYGLKIYHIDGNEYNNAIWNLATYDDLKGMGLA